MNSKKNKKAAEFTESLTDRNLYKGIYICCLETFNFIMNIERLPFQTMIEIAEIDTVSMWRVVYSFARIEKNMMPIPIVKHFLEIEIRLITF